MKTKTQIKSLLDHSSDYLIAIYDLNDLKINGQCFLVNPLFKKSVAIVKNDDQIEIIKDCQVIHFDEKKISIEKDSDDKAFYQINQKVIFSGLNSIHDKVEFVVCFAIPYHRINQSSLFAWLGLYGLQYEFSKIEMTCLYATDQKRSLDKIHDQNLLCFYQGLSHEIFCEMYDLELKIKYLHDQTQSGNLSEIEIDGLRETIKTLEYKLSNFIISSQFSRSRSEIFYGRFGDHVLYEYHDYLVNHVYRKLIK